MKIAMFPGTFDPPTLGHIDIIKRTSGLFEKLYVVVANNPSKNTLFSAEERKQLLVDILKDYKNIEVVIWNGLTVDFAKENNVQIMIRGVRTSSDFDYEFELAETNKILYPSIEVLFMPTNPKYFLIRSSSIKEMAAFGADVSNMVPKEVIKAMKMKLKVKQKA